jgi:hypothetical protein
VSNVPIKAQWKEQNAEEQTVTSAGQNIGDKVPSWLYVAIGFAVVFVIGAYVLSTN